MLESEKEILYDIQRTLHEIRSLFILANQDKLEEMKKQLLPKGSVKEKIYRLCDGTRSTADIAQLIGKNENYVRSYLSILRREGLIRTVERDEKLVHEQII